MIFTTLDIKGNSRTVKGQACLPPTVQDSQHINQTWLLSIRVRQCQKKRKLI